MRRQTARPLRACGALLALYVGGRVSLGMMYPDLAVSGLGPFQPPLPLPGLAAAPARAAPARVPAPAPGTAAAALVESRGAESQPPFARPMVSAGVGPVALARVTRVTRVTVPRRERAVELAAITPRPRLDSAPVPPPNRAPDRMATPEPVRVAAASPAPQGLDPVVQPVARPVAASRWSGSAWLLLREGSGPAPLATGGTLGGSQAGARISWRPGASPLFVTVRGSAALAQRDSEIAPGIGVQGHGIGVIVEQRFRLERGRKSQPALVAFGGFSSKRLTGELKADGYAQAGVVGVSNAQLFGDGAVRVEQPLTGAAPLRLALGAGAWAAAQPGASRVDVGPQLVAHVPVGRQGLRLSVDYRLRVAGTARPSSGVVFTAGADF